MNETDREKKLEKAMKTFSCTKCKYRTDTGKTTNLGPQCLIGYKQNPKTVQAARNLLANGGKLCGRHPLKHLIP